MKIDRVTVRYGELRSSGYPNFSNKRIEIELGAEVTPGQTPRAVKDILLMEAKGAVLEAFGEDTPTGSTMDIPF